MHRMIAYIQVRMSSLLADDFHRLRGGHHAAAARWGLHANHRHRRGAGQSSGRADVLPLSERRHLTKWILVRGCSGILSRVHSDHFDRHRRAGNDGRN